MEPKPNPSRRTVPTVIIEQLKYTYRKPGRAKQCLVKMESPFVIRIRIVNPCASICGLCAGAGMPIVAQTLTCLLLVYLLLLLKHSF